MGVWDDSRVNFLRDLGDLQTFLVGEEPRRDTQSARPNIMPSVTSDPWHHPGLHLESLGHLGPAGSAPPHLTEKLRWGRRQS